MTEILAMRATLAALFVLCPALALAGPRAAPPRPSKAAPQAAPARLVTTVEGVTEYRLDNGLRVLLFPDASKPTFTVNVTYFVGSREEGLGESGMAHLLEHMLFKGTQKLDQIGKLVQQRGGFFNGSTDYDRTNYFEVLPASEENLDWALRLEADRMVNSRVSDKDLATEFSVVRNEFEMGENDATGILEERMFSSAYEWHAYGRSVIGSKSDIERVPGENLRAFYRVWYQPDNAMLMVAGKFDPRKALAIVEDAFGAIPRPARKLPSGWTVEPVQDGERAVTLRRAGDVAVAGLVYHALAAGDPDFAAEEAVVNLLTDHATGRLYRALVETGLAAEVNGTAYRLADPGVMELVAKVRAGQSPEAVQQKMIEIVEGLAKEPPTKEEVERFQLQHRRQFDLAMADSTQIGIGISDFAASGDWRLLFLQRDRAMALTPAQVQRFAATFLKPANRTAGLFLPTQTPDRAPLATRPDVKKAVEEYRSAEKVSEGEAFEAKVESIEKRTERGALASGLKWALLAKRTRGQIVKGQLQIHYGSEAALAGKLAAAGLLPPMLLRGTKHHDHKALKDALDRQKAQLDCVPMGPGMAHVGFTTTRENLPGVLALLREILTEPAFAPAELEVLRRSQLADVEESLQDPQELAFTAIMGALMPYPRGDVRHVSTPAERVEDLKAVKLADVTGLFTRDFGGSAATLALVGDFDPAEAKALLEKELGGWKSPRPYQRIVATAKPGAGSEKVIVTPDKQMAFVAAGQGIAMRDDDPDYPALRIAGELIGGGAPSRLNQRLREKEGLSYGAFGFAAADAFDARAQLFAGALCASTNAEKCLAAMMEELTRAVGGGATGAELTAVQKEWKLRFEHELAMDDFLAGALARDLWAGRTLAFEQSVTERAAKLTPAELDAFLKKWFAPDRFHRVRAGDSVAAPAPPSGGGVKVNAGSSTAP